MKIFTYVIIALSVITIVFNATKIDFEKPFEGEHNFVLISLPPDIQRQVAHSMELIYSIYIDHWFHIVPK